MIFKPHDDFDLDKIFLSGQCFRIKKYDDTHFRFITNENVLHIKKTDEGTYDADCDNATWDNIWHDYFDLNRNYSKIRSEILNDDIVLKNMADFGKGIRIARQEAFEMIITFIISQRKSIPAIKTSVEALCLACGEKTNVNGDDIFLFPSAKNLCALSDDELSACGLGYRVPYIKDAAKIASESDDFLNELSNLSDDDILQKLMQIKGVGTKVANCISLFAYARVNLAPIDVWIQRIIEQDFNNINPFERYEKNAGIYQQYMFYYAQMNKK